jgi:endonuclease YncB( thermonuclease family)
MRSLCVFLLALLAPLTANAKPLAFQKIENCQWKADRWNDGDSFHAMLGDGRGEIVVRLYFVDAPEDETAYRLRISEQAEYFGITPEQAKEVAHEAAAFTAQRLAKPFTVWTRWNSALGRSVLGRVYCIIITAEGRDLNELLVENGLARIYGTRTPLPDGRDSRTYRARLSELEAKAKAAKKGAWRFTGAAPPAKPVALSGAFLASKNSEVFHKAGCKSGEKILATNIVRYQSREEATRDGRRPCAECRP